MKTNLRTALTFPFYLDFVVESVFGNVKPLPFKIPNHYQIILGHDVWLGYGVKILSGVKIGNRAVVGAGAVVAKDIPPYAIAVGNPARVIKYRFDEETIKKLLAVKWWNWDLKKIADNMPLVTDVEKFLAIHYSPALENFPEDDLSRLIENFGGRVYQFIADFRAARPLWKKLFMTSATRTLKKICSSFILARTRRKKIFNRWQRKSIASTAAREKIFCSSPRAIKIFRSPRSGRARTSSPRATW